jgi:hypothetical protein
MQSKRNLFVEYNNCPGSSFEDFGEVLDLATVSDADLRAAVEEWLKPCPDRPCGGHIVKDEEDTSSTFMATTKSATPKPALCWKATNARGATLGVLRRHTANPRAAETSLHNDHAPHHKRRAARPHRAS